MLFTRSLNPSIVDLVWAYIVAHGLIAFTVVVILVTAVTITLVLARISFKLKLKRLDVIYLMEDRYISGTVYQVSLEDLKWYQSPLGNLADYAIDGMLQLRKIGGSPDTVGDMNSASQWKMILNQDATKSRVWNAPTIAIPIAWLKKAE